MSKNIKLPDKSSRNKLIDKIITILVERVGEPDWYCISKIKELKEK